MEQKNPNGKHHFLWLVGEKTATTPRNNIVEDEVESDDNLFAENWEMIRKQRKIDDIRDIEAGERTLERETMSPDELKNIFLEGLEDGLNNQENGKKPIKRKAKKKDENRRDLKETVATKEDPNKHAFLQVLENMFVFEEDAILWLKFFKKKRVEHLQRLYNYNEPGKHKTSENEHKFPIDGRTMGPFQILTPKQIQEFVNSRRQEITEERQDLSEEGQKVLTKKWTDCQLNLWLREYEENKMKGVKRYPGEHLREEYAQRSQIRQEVLRQKILINGHNNQINTTNNNNHHNTTTTNNITNINLHVASASPLAFNVPPNPPPLISDKEQSPRQLQSASSTTCANPYNLPNDEINSLCQLHDLDILFKNVFQIMHSHSNYCIKSLLCSILLSKQQTFNDLPARIANLYTNKKTFFDVFHTCQANLNN